MARTLRGIYHNLKESEYATSNSEVAFFFSSRLYLSKFMEEHKEHRKAFITRIGRVMDIENVNLDLLADLHFYSEIEKRGFRVVDENRDIGKDELSWQEIHLYALQKVTAKSTHDWFEMHEQKRIE